MKAFFVTLSSALLLSVPLTALAGPDKDCLLEGTVYKSEANGTGVKFHSAKKYDKDSNCRVRRGEKLEFKLPDDPRLEEAPAGSSVKYRYQENSDGSSKTELVKIST